MDPPTPFGVEGLSTNEIATSLAPKGQAARNDVGLDKYIVTGCEGVYTWGVIGD